VCVSVCVCVSVSVSVCVCESVSLRIIFTLSPVHTEAMYLCVCFSLFFDEGRFDLASTIFRLLKPEVILLLCVLHCISCISYIVYLEARCIIYSSHSVSVNLCVKTTCLCVWRLGPEYSHSIFSLTFVD